MRSRIASSLGLVALLAFSSMMTGASAAGDADADRFDVDITTSPKGIEVHAASGCRFETVSYDAGEESEWSVRLTESGIAGGAESGIVPGGDDRPAAPDRFSIAIYYSGSELRALSAEGCRWTELRWSCGNGSTCRARLSEGGVRVLGVSVEETDRSNK